MAVARAIARRQPRSSAPRAAGSVPASEMAALPDRTSACSEPRLDSWP
jgi:hypothetical protein